MRIGWATMGDLLTDPVTGTRLTQQERYRMIIDGAVTAEATGFWSASVGEHHFCDYIVSAPPVVLAAIAERTSTIRVGTAVALGANNDPIRLAEDYATLDVISGGRVELVVGRGNLYEHTFTAFGQDPRQSRPLYEERVGLLVEALHDEQLQWTGETRAPFRNFTTQPRPVQERVPVWVGGGSSLDSAEFAARAGLPLMVPGVLGPPRVFVPLVERFRERWAELGHDPAGCQVGTIAHTFVGRTSQETFATAAPRFATYLGWVAELVAISTPSMAGFIKETSLEVLADRGPTVCGSPQQVVDKIGLWRDTLGLDVFLAMCDLGGMPPAELHPMLELMGSDVLPAFHGEAAPPS
jgi:alkanesulfonate monooxygenase SsuD/methylene tetrahydromethanopterin reductase-like flavin-dependent oxidoreductase (luciferase family)